MEPLVIFVLSAALILAIAWAVWRYIGRNRTGRIDK